MKGPQPNARFAPPPGAAPARHRFAGELVIAGAPMTVNPATVAAAPVLGRRIDRFPTVRLGFVAAGDDLVPLERDLVPPGDGESYWSLIVGPGRVWWDATDGGPSRGAFPFALCHPLENDSHHGLATFTFDDDGAHGLVVQVVQRTAPFLVRDIFTAWATLACTYRRRDVDPDGRIARAHAAEVSGRLPVRPWSELAGRCDPALLAAVEDGHDATAIAHALVADGTIYAQPYRTPFGDYPYPEAMAFGVWSVTKSASAMLAALRLAALRGDGIFRTRVADVLDVTATHDGWRDVTLGDCLDMATGIGDAGGAPGPGITGDYITEFWNDPVAGAPYRSWYQAESREAKLAAAFACGRMAWGPGVHARYRDQDLFMAMAVLDRLHGGKGLWDTMQAEVYGPIGIAHLPTTLTAGPDGIPPGAFGLFLTLDAAAKIAGLLHDRGRLGSRQILSQAKVAEILDPDGFPPRPTGETNAAGEIGYRNTFWYLPFRDRAGRLHRIPYMSGYGGNVVALFPNGMTGLRFAHDRAPTDRWYATGLARVADALRPFN